ncbi:splicing factor 3A subunit 1-like [Corticium candelabrum]|uniref:splicing factor 3A subunit 1-like n=1 Tax=Corticium candelabrum TaxID=121492 RepID=UPI002E256618|nr:splicing factor 3A subunit 1-like [Corticium candelabrum]
MPEVVTVAEENREQPTSKPLVGIIYPPPEVRNIVDKTANFVARNGVEFEIRIKQNEQGNPKFNFLNAEDPYHAYYQHKMKEFKEGKGQETTPGVQKVAKPVQQQKVIEEIPVPTEPPLEWEFSAEPPSISAFDLDLVKLTAQFVARNGRQFLTTLMSKEQYNAQFDFLRPQHHLFQYFTKLVEQYTKILIPAKDLLDRLRKESQSPGGLLDHVNNRYYWARHQERQKKKLEEEAEKERVAFAQVDWHDFVLVETVDFPESDPALSYPPPVTLEQLGSRILAQQRYDQLQEERRAMADDTAMDIDEDDDDDMTMGDTSTRERKNDAPPLPSTPAPPAHPPLPSMPPPPAPPGTQPKAPGVQTNTPIRKDYDPKAPKVRPHAPKGPTTDEYMVSPITGERIRADKFEEHMRYGLLDPRWREQKNKEIEEKREQEEVFAAGTSVSSSLKHLAERRTDIFGQEETYIGKKVGEEEEKKQNQEAWDVRPSPDHTSTGMGSSVGLIQLPPRPPAPPTSIPFTPPMPPLQMHPPRLSFQPPLPPPPPVSVLQPRIPIGMGIPPPPPSIEESAAKRPRVEQGEGNFIPEQQFILSHPGPVTIKVQVAKVSDKPEWNLNGQILSLAFPITDQVSTIKSKLSDMLGIPPGKQKLQMANIFIKDSNSLAYYNMTSQTIVQLGLKERGGRKK